MINLNIQCTCTTTDRALLIHVIRCQNDKYTLKVTIILPVATWRTYYLSYTIQHTTCTSCLSKSKQAYTKALITERVKLESFNLNIMSDDLLVCWQLYLNVLPALFYRLQLTIGPHTYTVAFFSLQLIRAPKYHCFLQFTIGPCTYTIAFFSLQLVRAPKYHCFLQFTIGPNT